MEQDRRAQENKALGAASKIKNLKHQLLPNAQTSVSFSGALGEKKKTVLWLLKKIIIIIRLFCCCWFVVVFSTGGRESNRWLVLHLEQALLQGYVAEPFLLPCTS